MALLCFVLAGALLGFLRWNFHPASIFTGTSGVMFLGFTLAAPLDPRHREGGGGAPRARRADHRHLLHHRPAAGEGRSPFSPDRGHIHHRLLDLGLTHTQTVLVIYAICIGLAVLSLVLSGTGQLYAFLGVFVVFGLVLLAC